MRTTWVFLSSLLLVLILPAAVGTRGGGPEWLEDVDEAFELATKSGRPLLVVFR